MLWLDGRMGGGGECGWLEKNSCKFYVLENFIGLCCNSVFSAGAFMFIAIEGGGDKEREDEMKRQRDHLATRLWNMTCCEINVFNKTEFNDL